MKKSLILVVILAFSVITIKAQSKAELKVAEAVNALNRGIIDPDKSLLESVTSKSLSYGHSGGKLQNQAEFIDDLFNGDFNFSSINPTDQTISVSGKNAIVRQIFVAEATNNGVPTDIRIGNLMVWRKECGSWKMLARQAFRL